MPQRQYSMHSTSSDVSPRDDWSESVGLIPRLQMQAVRQPDAEALGDSNGVVTYGTLVDCVARTAAALGDLRATAPVVVRCDWGIDSVVNVLAVLWAGGAVVPLSMEDPQSRVEEVVHRVRAHDVVGPGASGPGRAGTGELAEGAGIEPLRRAADPTGAVFFTSGSLGRPKGVVRSVLDIDRHIERELANGDLFAPQRTAMFMPLHFAGGFTTTMGGLAAGRFTSLVDARHLSRAALDELLRERRIERLHLAPSLLHTLATSASPGGLASVREIWVGGEVLDAADVELVRQRLPHVVVLCSYYAASELTAVLAVHRIELGPRHSDHAAENSEENALERSGDSLRVPIGRPRNPSGIRVDQVPDAEGWGELVVRGEVAQYYIDDDALTAERFGADDDGVRFWRTGDLVHLDSNGVLWPRGRRDDVVKINGRLVAPLEAELILRGLTGVRDAVVTTRRRPSGVFQLVAHVVVDEGTTSDALRSAMRRVLPAHLIPGVLMRHDSLPVTDRGKTDSAALRAMDVVPWRSSVPTGVIGPRLSMVCAEVALVLDLDEVMPDDRLWDLGLDSLRALEIVTSLSEMTGVDIDPSSVVGLSTCRELVALAASASSQRPSHIVAINDTGDRRPIFAVAGAGGTALAFRFLASELGARQPLVVFEQYGLHHRVRADRTIDAVAKRNLADLRRRQPTGPYMLMGYSWGGLVAQHMASILLAEGHNVLLVLLDAQRRSVPVLDPAPIPPPVVAQRRDIWPVWAVKWLIWRSVCVRRSAGRRWKRFLRPVGTEARYGAFFRFAIRAAQANRITPLAVRGALICPDGSTVIDQWDDHPNLRRVVVGGDHLSMMRYPNVNEVAAVVRELIADGDRATTGG